MHCTVDATRLDGVDDPGQAGLAVQDFLTMFEHLRVEASRPALPPWPPLTTRPDAPTDQGSQSPDRVRARAALDRAAEMLLDQAPRADIDPLLKEVRRRGL